MKLFSKIWKHGLLVHLEKLLKQIFFINNFYFLGGIIKGNIILILNYIILILYNKTDTVKKRVAPTKYYPLKKNF